MSVTTVLFSAISITALVLTKPAFIHSWEFNHTTHLIVSIIAILVSFAWLVVDAHICPGTWIRLLILLPLTPFYAFFCFYKRSLHTKKTQEEPVPSNQNPVIALPLAPFPNPLIPVEQRARFSLNNAISHSVFNDQTPIQGNNSSPSKEILLDNLDSPVISEDHPNISPAIKSPPPAKTHTVGAFFQTSNSNNTLTHPLPGPSKSTIRHSNSTGDITSSLHM